MTDIYVATKKLEIDGELIAAGQRVENPTKKQISEGLVQKININEIGENPQLLFDDSENVEVESN